MSRDDMYKTCRWCKYFDRKTQTCINDRAFDSGNDFDFSPFYEGGALAEAIRDGFNDFIFYDLKQALIESKLSKKRIAEIMKIFYDEFDNALIDWTESIDGQVSRALNHFDFSYLDGVSIKDPSEFHCKHFF